jgi:ubiquinone/menaquinone biosynthesis C-methylase UbiE
MSQALIGLHSRLPRRARRAISRIQYEYLSHMDRDGNMLFMNYGWADLDPEAKEMPLGDNDEPNRYCIQLYHHMAGSVDLSGRDVLEVGCGRGGGASYIKRRLNPRSVVGVDITARAISFCNRHYDVPGLSFVRGGAESLQFDDNSFDVIVNIESSHCYASMERFLEGVHRVLRPDGRLLLADLRPKEKVDTLRQQLEKSGLTLLREERITPHIVRALDLDNERKRKLIKQNVPRPLQSLFSEFAGMKGTHASYDKLKSGDIEYLSFALRK